VQTTAQEAPQNGNGLSEEQARAIANKFFERQPRAGVYAEDRG
jgi:hypothetical protein